MIYKHILKDQKPVINLGCIYLTKDIKQTMFGSREFSKFVWQSLTRHVQGDWGKICTEEWQENEVALKNGSRIFSTYPYINENDNDGRVVCIISEPYRSTTTSYSEELSILGSELPGNIENEKSLYWSSLICLRGGFFIAENSIECVTDTPWLKPKEAAGYCKISPSLFNQLRKDLPIKTGGTKRRPRFKKSELDAWMERGFKNEDRSFKEEKGLCEYGNNRDYQVTLLE